MRLGSMSAAAAACLLAACAAQPQTYRDLDRIAADYQRGSNDAGAPASEPQTAESAAAEDACGAGRYQNLVGQPASGIDRATLPAHTRVITPDMMVTMDFSPQRLNVIVGSDGKVGSLACY